MPPDSSIFEQQWRDILGIIRVQAETLDQDYLRHWAEHLDLLDLLESAFVDTRI